MSVIRVDMVRPASTHNESAAEHTSTSTTRNREANLDRITQGRSIVNAELTRKEDVISHGFSFHWRALSAYIQRALIVCAPQKHTFLFMRIYLD